MIITQNKHLHKSQGFTLVELAIVIFIIGIILASVLQVKELLENSKVKSVMNDFNGIAVAYYAYRDRVGSVPGDSDKDGRLDTTNTFWQDLRAEGFITGAQLDNSPAKHSLEGDFTAQSIGAFNGKNCICASNIISKYAKMIDNQMDDGSPSTGNIRTLDLSEYPQDPEEPVVICRELSSVHTSNF